MALDDQRVSINGTSVEVEIDGSLPAGLYFLVFRSAGGYGGHKHIMFERYMGVDNS